MNTVESLSSAMLEAYLKGEGWKYTVDSDGDYKVEFSHSNTTDCELTMWLILTGSSKSIYKVMFLSDKTFDEENWGGSVLLCNKWNVERRWPKAHFRTVERRGRTVGTIVLEGNWDFGPGVHQELLNSLTDNVFYGATSFWEWMKDQPLGAT
ncbi:MAG: YbjN domain-containing protein [Dehalococcoidia bacterium]